MPACLPQLVLYPHALARRLLWLNRVPNLAYVMLKHGIEISSRFLNPLLSLFLPFIRLSLLLSPYLSAFILLQSYSPHPTHYTAFQQMIDHRLLTTNPVLLGSSLLLVVIIQCAPMLILFLKCALTKFSLCFFHSMLDS